MAKNQYQSALEKANADLDKMYSKWDAIDKKILQISQNARKSTGQDFSSGSPKQLNSKLQKNVQFNEQLNAELKEQERLEKALINAIAKKNLASESTNKALIKQRYETQQLNKLNKEEAVLASKVATFYQKQSVVLNRLTRRRADLLLKQNQGIKLTKIEEKELTKLTASQTKLDKALKKTDAQNGRNFRNVGNYIGALKNLATSLIGAFGVVEGLRRVFDFTKEANALARESKGVEFAFQRLGKRGVDAFNSIKLSTRGLISDIDIKTALNEFENFNISLAETDTLFEFLAVRSAQTGKSIEQLQSSLVEGLSKESKLRIDNLGISTADLNNELKKTPNFVQAVANIAKREVAKAGDILDKAANSQEKWNAKLENFKLFIGKNSSGITNFFFKLGNSILDAVAPTEKLSDGLRKQQVELNILATRLTATNIKEDERKKLIQELNDKYPQFLKNIDTEKATTKELQTALKNANNEYINKIILQREIEKGDVLAQKAADAGIYQREREQTQLEKLVSAETALGIEVDLSKTRTERLAIARKKAREESGFGKIAANSLLKSLTLLNEQELEASKDAFSVKYSEEKNKAFQDQADKIAKLREELGLLEEEEEEKKGKPLGDPEDDKRAKTLTLIEMLKEASIELRKEQHKLFIDGQTDVAEYNKGLDKIDQSIEDLANGLKAIKNLDNPLGELITPADSEVIEYLRKQIEELEAELEALGSVSDEFTLMDGLEGILPIINQIGTLLSTLYDGNIQKIDDEIAKNDEKYARILDNERLTADQRAAIEAEQERKRLALEKKKREEKRKQAIANKAFGATEVIINTAISISKLLGNPIAIALASTLGALQLATVLAAPIPQYKTGRKGGKKEVAVLGDGGKHEPIIDRQGRLKSISPNTPTLTQLEAGDSVLPSIDHLANYDVNQIIGNGINMSMLDQQDKISRSQQAQLDLSAQLQNLFKTMPQPKIYNNLSTPSADQIGEATAKAMAKIGRRDGR